MDKRRLLHSIAGGLLLGSLVLSGCAALEKNRNGGKGDEKIDALTRQAQETHQRAETLNKDNEEQQAIIAQAEQLRRQAEEKASQAQAQVQTLNAEIARLRDDLNDKEQKVQTLNAAFQRQSTVTITPNNSLLKHTPVFSIAGVNVVQNSGDMIRIDVNDSVLFHPNTTQLLPTAGSVIGGVMNEIRANYRNNTIGIEGHTDSFVETQKNPMSAIDLSQRKANAVASYLLEQKILDAKQLKVTAFGSARPILDNKTPEGRSRNNRIEFVVYP